MYYDESVYYYLPPSRWGRFGRGIKDLGKAEDKTYFSNGLIVLLGNT